MKRAPVGVRRSQAQFTAERHEFAAFFAEAEPRLRRAFAASYGPEGAADAVAEALTWAWAHWERVRLMENRMGYLYRVAQTATRTRRKGSLPALEATSIPLVEPRLVPAMRCLPERQRSAVWLVVGCHFTQTEAAEAMGISRSAVSTHVERALAALRASLAGSTAGSES